MNSFTRLRLGLRSVLVELPLSTYLVTSVITLVALCIFGYYRWAGVFVSHPDELTFVHPEAILALFSTLALIPAFFISVNFFTKRFKDGGRAEDFLLLPLANGERFALSLLFSWVVVPLITYLPVLLLLIATGVIGQSYLIGPSPLSLLQIFLWALAIYYALSIFWLFPAIAFPKYAILLVFGLVAISVTSILVLNKVFPAQTISYSIDGAVFKDPRVVGMHEIASFDEPVPRSEIDATYDQGDDGWAYLPMLLASPLLLFAAFRAITRKQA